MLFKGVFLEAAASVLPPVAVTSDEVEQRLAPLYERLKLPFGRLELMTGIKERRFWEPGTTSSRVAAEAGKKAVGEAGIDPAEIGCLIHASVCRDFLEPATASVVHHELGLSREAAMFDLSNACLGVLNGMAVVAGMIQRGDIEAGLVVSGEAAEPLHEATITRALSDESITRRSFKDHFASLTIGSGAAAVLLTGEKLSRKKHALLGGAVLTDSASSALCREDRETPAEKAGPLMATDSEALLHAGCELALETWMKMKSTLNWENSTPDKIFTHQVGKAHKNLLFEKLGLDPGKDFPTVEKLGNTGSAALPTALALGIEQKKIRPGENVALLGIGSGLSSMMLGVQW